MQRQSRVGHQTFQKNLEVENATQTMLMNTTTEKPVRLYKKTDNFTQLYELYAQSTCSDLTLQLYDEMLLCNGAATTEPWLTIQTHRFVLCANSAYFQKLLVQQSPCLRLYIALDGMEQAMLRHFFGLFYLPRLDERSLTPQEVQFLDENVLYMYKLAHYFSFQALANYCERRIFESMNCEHFKAVLNFCLDGGGLVQPRRVIAERLGIYTHMLQWYKCCIEHTPYLPVSPPPRRNSGSESSSSDDPGTPRLSVTYYSCNKEEILDEMTQAVPEIEQYCLVPQKTVVPLTAWHTRLQYYRRCCLHCLNGTRQCIGLSVKPCSSSQSVNMGSLKKRYANGYEHFHFSLKRVDRDWFLELQRQQQPLHPKRTGRPQHPVTEELCFESDSTSRYQCVTSVELLSAVATERLTTQSALLQSLSMPLHLCAVPLHKPKHCYVGKCDNCRNKQPLYILICRVDLYRTTSQQDQGMDVT
jgi:hypothetical protein